MWCSIKRERMSYEKFTMKYLPNDVNAITLNLKLEKWDTGDESLVQRMPFSSCWNLSVIRLLLIPALFHV